MKGAIALLLTLAACGAPPPAPEYVPPHCRATYWIVICGDAGDPTYDAGADAGAE